MNLGVLSQQLIHAIFDMWPAAFYANFPDKILVPISALINDQPLSLIELIAWTYIHCKIMRIHAYLL